MKRAAIHLFLFLGACGFFVSPTLADISKNFSQERHNYFTPTTSNANKKVAFRWPWEKKPKKKCHCCRLVINHGQTVTNCTYICKCNDGNATCTIRPECAKANEASNTLFTAARDAQAATTAAENAKRAALKTQAALESLKKRLQSAKGSAYNQLKAQYDQLKRVLTTQIAAYNALRRVALSKIAAAKTALSNAKYWDQKCPRKCSYSKCLGPNICQITQALTFNAAKFEIDMRTVENTAKRNNFEIDMRVPSF